MVKGSFMVTEVLGGDSTISKASHNMEQYFQDFRRTSMAMNFTMLVTDRQLQPDSSKWITKLYHPVY
jgi:ABC-type spermidine/putrescine transport system permease subunit I